MDDDDGYTVEQAIIRSRYGLPVDPTKVKYQRRGIDWKTLDRAGIRAETTQGKAPEFKQEYLADLPAEPEPMGWHYITIPEEDDDNNTGAGER